MAQRLDLSKDANRHGDFCSVTTVTVRPQLDVFDRILAPVASILSTGDVAKSAFSDSFNRPILDALRFDWVE